ncbi:hypothetical protein HPB52_008261 [Rhipicephalus sanguineus]|uniref:Uncharacterized protein n=1 Tax=Rhipicephalus sanguineus TaxID=34632 RepID=A0A9D4T346_RHISA|nr:hypothetical protein HPB52_008261 [Rhipicephalus sanguineus]
MWESVAKAVRRPRVNFKRCEHPIDNILLLQKRQHGRKGSVTAEQSMVESKKLRCAIWRGASRQMREGGLLDKWLAEISAPGWESVVPQVSSSSERELDDGEASASLEHFLATFLLLGLGLGIAAIVL